MSKVAISYGGSPVGVDTWTVTQAKAKLNEIIEKARSFGPQTITLNGRAAAMVVAAEESEKKSKGNLAEFFASSPLRGSGLKIVRFRGGVRRTGL